MTLADIFGQIAGGLRLSLMLFAFMSLLARGRALPEVSATGWRDQHERARRLNARGWFLIALAALAYSPLHAAYYLGHPADPAVARLGDVLASGLASAAFITRLAARGLATGLSDRRVARGVHVNCCVALAIVGAAWLTR
ncbi:MAG: hypothetical protein OSB00_15045 [Sphingomonas bacterium]|nr:hypothetical protein [Sphingomonas bacterium]